MDDTTFFWSRSPGRWLNKLTGDDVTPTLESFGLRARPGSDREWNETLVETIIDCVNVQQDKAVATHGPSRRFVIDVYVSPKVFRLLESSALFTPVPGLQIGQISDMIIHESSKQDRDVARIEAVFNPEEGGRVTTLGQVLIQD